MRTVRVEHGADGTLVVSGVRDLVVLNTTDSEFTGFAVDSFTTLPPATDRVLATAIAARWRCSALDGPDEAGVWDDRVRPRPRMPAGRLRRDLQLRPPADAVRDGGPGGRRRYRRSSRCASTLPNRHHFLVDLTPFGLDNPNAVYHAADRPYGLIEGTVLRAGTAADPRSW